MGGAKKERLIINSKLQGLNMYNMERVRGGKKIITSEGFFGMVKNF